MKKLKMMIVNDEISSIKPYLYLLRDKGLKFNADYEYSAQVAGKYNPLDYDILIIDSSDDIPINNRQSLSKYWKEKNPNSIIIGTSVQIEIINDKLAKDWYDERVCVFYQRFDEAMVQILKKRGLFQEAIKK